MISALSPEEHFAAQKLARNDLYVFTRYMFLVTRGYPWRQAPHHKLICDKLMDVYEGRRRRVIFNIPPRYSKTELAVVNFMAWALGREPDCEFIHATFSGSLAANNSFNCRKLLQAPEYGQIFPNTHISWERRATDHWKTTAGGHVFARGIEGQITGLGAGKARPGFGGAVILDDLNDPKDVKSETIFKTVQEFYQLVIARRLNDPQNTPIIVIQQRVHEEDFTGWISAGNTGEDWDVVRLPALAEENDPLGRSPGEALWPQMHTSAMLRQMSAVAPVVFAGQYQQRPSPAEGNVFKPDKLVVVDSPPQGRYVRAWDFAGTEDGGDWTVGFLVGETPDLRPVLADVVRLQGSPDQVEEALIATAHRDGKSVRISLPQDPGQAGKMQVQYLARKLHGFIVTGSPESGDKVTRAAPIAAQINLGNALMVRGEWNAALVHELRNFPNGKYDDQVDALSRGYGDLVSDMSGDAFFSVDPLLLNGTPLAQPAHCDGVFATICTGAKTGKPSDSVGVVFWALDRHASPFPLVVLEWELVHAEGALVETWIPSVFSRLEAYSRACGARAGSLGVFLDDSGTGAVLLQQALRFGQAQAIESRLTSMGKSERAISVSGYVMNGDVKLSHAAYGLVTTHRSITRNQLIGELLAFRVGAKEEQPDTLLDAFTYGCAIGIGTPTGF